MQLSLNWLKEYVPVTADPAEFAEKMTLSGSKVETFGRVSDDVSGVVIGKVIELRRHENSDKLYICQVDAGADINGGKPLQIVTAAPNVVLNAVVPVALIGGSVLNTHNHGSDRVMKIKKSKLGGYVSDGMMCGYDELGLSLDEVPYADPDGLLLLNDVTGDSHLGTDALEFFGKNDVTAEFEITNNRPDCLSVLGLAREAAAVFALPFTPPFAGSCFGTPVDSFALPQGFEGHKIITGDSGNGVTSATAELTVNIENTKLCSRYAAAVVKNVKIASSPKWLAERLQASGVRSINNFVDITNYVMLEYGHPLHAFDKRYVKGDTIIARSAKDGETITLLDGNTVTLDGDMLVIADSVEPIAIAGVMGGEYSGIMDDTLDVVFEAACFDSVSVRSSAKKAGRRTDASARFEKGLNPYNAFEPLIRALDLVKKLNCGDVCGEIIDVRNFSDSPVELSLDCDKIRQFLGHNITDDEQVDILKRLGFGIGGDTADKAETVRIGETAYNVIVPRTRIDIGNTYDLAEEVARIYGYNNIPSALPRIPPSRIKRGGVSEQRERVKADIIETMTANGFYETLTYGFTSEKVLSKAGYVGNGVRIHNPFGEDTAVMRTAVLPSLLCVTATNIADKNNEGRLFEIARAYLPNDGETGAVSALPYESERVAAVMYGGNDKNLESASVSDFYTLKGVVEDILAGLVRNTDVITYTACADEPLYHPGRCAAVTRSSGTASASDIIGFMGEIHPRVLDKFDIGKRVYGFEFFLDRLCEAANLKFTVKPLPKYPAVSRDLSLVCDNDVTCGAVLSVIRGKGKNLESADFFDLYDLGGGKKSMSFKLLFRRADSTLTDSDADGAVKRILNALGQIGVMLRQ